MTINSHHDIRQALRDRIESGEWQLGALIPGEMALADEYGCARTTINRALQTLANDGLVVRKRKGGTRVCEMPVRQAKFEIPSLREQVEATGGKYRHQIMSQKLRTPTTSVRTQLRISAGKKALFMETIHLADDSPYAYEQRWVNLQTVPEIMQAPLDQLSANEWLVKTVPFSSGDVVFSAENADKTVAGALQSDVGNAIFVVDRTTWMGEDFITTMKLYYKDGYQLYSPL
ncbi:MAG: GntR family histidine utilization transcriptional repressor [Arenicella sp.]|jgi:GntR family histidine utilization transcriptional repressor